MIYLESLILLEIELSKDFSRVRANRLEEGVHIYVLFTETSLKDTKDVVRRKLQLPSYSTIKLKQLRNGKYIDLDDGKTRRCTVLRLSDRKLIRR